MLTADYWKPINCICSLNSVIVIILFWEGLEAVFMQSNYIDMWFIIWGNPSVSLAIGGLRPSSCLKQLYFAGSSLILITGNSLLFNMYHFSPPSYILHIYFFPPLLCDDVRHILHFMDLHRPSSHFNSMAITSHHIRSAKLSHNPELLTPSGVHTLLCSWCSPS